MFLIEIGDEGCGAFPTQSTEMGAQPKEVVDASWLCSGLSGDKRNLLE